MIASFSTTIAVLNQALSRDAADEDHRDQRDDQERRQVEDDRDAEDVRRQLQRRRGAQHAFADAGEPALRHRRGHGVRRVVGGPVVGAEPGRQMHAEAAQQLLEVAGPRDGDGDVADRVLDDQIPADDPRHQLAERRVGVGVGGSRHRHHRRELGVAQRGEAAGDRRQHERQDDRRSGAQVIRPAGGRRPDRREEAGADDRADAEGGELQRAEGALQLLAAALGIGNQPGERLDAKDG